MAGFYASFIGGLYLGASLAPNSSGGGHVPVIPMEMVLLGVIGAVGWVIFDANVLAYDYRPRPERRLQTLAVPPTVRW